MSAAKHTPGHKLVTKTIQRYGRFGTYWTCECGDWHPPRAALAPWGSGPAPQDTVIAFIKRAHQQHAIAKAEVQS